MSYLDKYLKYKNKYLQLKKQIGGRINCNDISKIGFNNRIGTCWNVTIQTVMFYGDPYRNEIQEILEKFSSETIIDNAIKVNNLELLLPSHLLDGNNKILDKSKKILVDFIEDFKNINTIINYLKETNRENSFICEKDFVTKFFNLYKINRETYAGNFDDSKKLYNLLYVTLVNKGVYLSKINPSKIIDLEEIKKSFSIEIIFKLNGNEHFVIFFKCDDIQKFYNNNKIINYNWSSFFEKLIYLNKNKIDYKIKLHDMNGPIIIILNKLYKFGPNIIEQDIDKLDHLDFTSVNGNSDIVDFILIKEGNIGDILNNDEELWKTDNYLENIKFKKKLNRVKKINGKSALMIAIINNKLEKVQELLKYDPDFDIQNEDGKTALMYAIEKNNIEIIKELLNHNPDLNIQETYGKTPLMKAIENNNIEIIKELLKHDPDLNIQDRYGTSALMYAIEKNNIEIVKELLNHNPKPDLNIQDKNGSTPLMYAIDESNIEIIKELLNHNPDLNIKDKDGKTSLDIANIKNNKEIIELIKNYTPPL